MEICQECNKELKEIILFPHLIKENFFKQDKNISTIPSEILKDLPKSHLHVYYLCTCGHKTYRDEIELISEATVENCVDLIKAARANIFTAEAQSNVARSELPKIEEFATDPDAPSLEEQEKFDKAVRDIEDSYQKALEDYVKSRIETLESELKAMDLETLRTEAKLETSNIMALAVFMEEVQDQKTWRAIYSDKDFKEHEFKNIEEFRSTHGFIKDQLRLAYQELELNPDEVKN